MPSCRGCSPQIRCLWHRAGTGPVRSISDGVHPCLASHLAIWELKGLSSEPKMAVEGAPGCSPAVAEAAGVEQWFFQIGVLGPGQARPGFGPNGFD